MVFTSLSPGGHTHTHTKCLKLQEKDSGWEITSKLFHKQEVWNISLGAWWGQVVRISSELLWKVRDTPNITRLAHSTCFSLHNHRKFSNLKGQPHLLLPGRMKDTRTKIAWCSTGEHGLNVYRLTGENSSEQLAPRTVLFASAEKWDEINSIWKICF